MRFAALAILSSAAFAAAASSECDAQNILDACKATIQAQVDKCGGNDYICLCDAYTNMLTCYNNCPQDAEKPSVQNQVTAYCVAAAPLKSASESSRAAEKATKTADSAESTKTGETVPTTGLAKGTSTSEPTGAAQDTGAAAALAVPFGSLFAAVLALL